MKFNSAAVQSLSILKSNACIVPTRRLNPFIPRIAPLAPLLFFSLFSLLKHNNDRDFVPPPPRYRQYGSNPRPTPSSKINSRQLSYRPFPSPRSGRSGTDAHLEKRSSNLPSANCVGGGPFQDQQDQHPGSVHFRHQRLAHCLSRLCECHGAPSNSLHL